MENKTLSSEYTDRMEGLAHIHDLYLLKSKLKTLTTEWLQEGFEKEDIKEYISGLIDQV